VTAAPLAQRAAPSSAVRQPVAFHSYRVGTAANSGLPSSALVSSSKFAPLGRPQRVWVVGSVHAEVEKLQILHDEIGTLFRPGDRLIYLGNFIGLGERIIETIDEMLDFRRALIATPGVLASDVVYLRGGQEEMWSKLLQIQFAPNPAEVMQWMMGQGAQATLAAYRGVPQHGLSAAREGVMAMTRWTSQLRGEIRNHPGHEQLYNALRRAAFTGYEIDRPGGLLFVNAGLDTSKPLPTQGDAFWWGAPSWGLINKPYGQHTKIIRGFDPAHGGPAMTTYTLTIDGGAGYNGALVGACLTATGEVIDIIEV
jgi:hypothetical protein